MLSFSPFSCFVQASSTFPVVSPCRFFEPVDSRDVSPTDAAACDAMYAAVRATVQSGMASLQLERASDPGRCAAASPKSLAQQQQTVQVL